MVKRISDYTRPRLRVVHKLFLLLAVVMVLALVALGGSTAFNLRRGFVSYINDLDLDRLAPLAQALEQSDDATTGFTGLHDPAEWDTLLSKVFDLNHPPPHPPPPPPPPQPDAGPTPPPPVPLPPRISLLDGQHQLVAGPEPSAKALELPLRRGDRVIGWLSLRPLTEPAGSNDINFLASQIDALLWIASALLLLALVAAWVFTRHLLAPLVEVERGAEQLASGKYRVHLKTTRRDELGDLMRHMNRLSDALQAHETSRQRWIADISHELRTPLAIVRGEIEAMQDGIRQPSENGLRSLHDEVMRLDRLIEDLHQLVMADLGTLSHRPERLDLSSVLRDACMHFESKAHSAGLTLQTELQPAMVRADPDRARQLIDNLLNNSIRYSDAGGRIRVTCSMERNKVHVIVDDTPPGVPADTIPRLFEPLFRGEASRNRLRGGSGLGLAIAERIAKAHSGELIASPSPLGGLRIEWILPAADA